MSHLSDDEFYQAWRRLNALCGIHDCWRSREARKTHTDEFGIEVLPGERYYLREPAVGYPIKLSRGSMERLLIAVVASCPHVEAIADMFVDAEQKRMRRLSDAMNSETS